jgi:hypothetical protein
MNSAHPARLSRYAEVSTALALLSTAELTRLADDAEPLGSGIGGSTLTLELDGVKVFAKRVRLTDLERQPEHLMSTANLFGLPTHYQRNVGSAGFGVWRELAAHAMTSGWVLGRHLDCFPLMFHWRVLDGAASPKARPPPPEWTDIKRMSAYWADSTADAAADAAITQRLTALLDARASVLILMEHLPWTLGDWLAQRLSNGPAALESACIRVEAWLAEDIPRIGALGLLHGDAHHGNILTDGQGLYYADLGLASSARFALDASEQAYLQQNAGLDIAYTRSRWVNWLVKTWAPSLAEPAERMALVKRIAKGEAAQQLIPELPASVATMIQRHAAIADVINEFYTGLHQHSRSSNYPQAAIAALLRPSPNEAGFSA